MERRMAALYGHDPRELETGARMLALRGVHPTVEAARAALLKVQRDLPTGEADRAPAPTRLGPQRLHPACLRRIRLGQLRTSERDKYAHWRLKATLGF